MKTTLFKKLALLACSSFLVIGTGCKGGNGKNSGDVDPYDQDGYNLLWEYDGGEIVDVNEEELADFLDDEIGEGASNAIRDLLGEYLYDYTIDHSHLETEELCEFITLIVDITSGDEPADSFKALAKKAPDLVADKVLATLIEIKDDEKAFGDFVYLMTSDDEYEFGSGPRPNYENANKALGGGDAGIKDMAEQEIAYKKARIGRYAAWYADDILEQLAVEEGIYLVRFIQHALAALDTELNDDELVFTLCGMFDANEGPSYELAEQYVINHMAQYISHLGAAFKMMNPSTNSWETLYTKFQELITLLVNSDEATTDEFVDYEFFIKNVSNINNLFATLNPKGLNVAVTFLSDIATKITEDIVWAEQVYDEGKGEYYTDVFFNFKALARIFNEVYGQLAADDKDAMNSATGILGFQLSDVGAALEKAKTVGNSEDFGAILYDTIGANFAEKFILEDYYRGCLDGDGLFFKQNTQITAKLIEDAINDQGIDDLENKEKSGSYSRFGDGDYVKSLVLVEPISTLTAGQFYAHIRFDFMYNGEKLTKEFVIIISIVPENVKAFTFSSLRNNYGRAYTEDGHEYYDYYGDEWNTEGVTGRRLKLFVQQNYAGIGDDQYYFTKVVADNFMILDKETGE